MPTSYITPAQYLDIFAEYGRKLYEDHEKEVLGPVRSLPGVPTHLPSISDEGRNAHSALLHSSLREGLHPKYSGLYKSGPPPIFPDDENDPFSKIKACPPPPPPQSPIGIIGGGPAGLYAGLVLDSLNIKYEILEASDRVGGRVHTHHFPQKPGEPNGTHDYYDLGAMRFPETLIMTRTFNLFQYEPLNTGDIQVAKNLIPYYFDAKDENGIFYYNGNRFRDNDLPAVRKYNYDPFQDKQLGVPDIYLKVGTKKIYTDVITPFAEKLEYDLNHPESRAGWDYLMEFDSYSTRSYMSHFYTPSDELVALGLPRGEHLPTNVVNWIEGYDKTSGWYDRALATTVLEEMAFGFTTKQPQPIVNYWCIDGGTQILTDSMAKYISRRTNNKGILLEHRVTSVSIENPSQKDSPLNVTINVNGQTQVKTYPHVISTPPLPILRHTMDISGCELSSFQTSALRQLAYTPSVKIGIKFRSPWWTSAKDRDGNLLNIVGGRSFTDRPVRIVVYPSYGLGEPDKPAVLIASFVWTEDAARVGALIGTGNDTVDQELKNMVLRDLADIHNLAPEFLFDQCLDIYSVAWAHNPLTMGAFALFGPGKFQDLYESLLSPAGGGKFHFAGEAVSVRHGWIVGALDSVWRCVYQILMDSYPDKIPDFLEKWGFNTEWLQSGSDDAKASAVLPEGIEVIDYDHPPKLPKTLPVPTKPTLGKLLPPRKGLPKEGEHHVPRIPQQKNNLLLRHIALHSK